VKAAAQLCLVGTIEETTMIDEDDVFYLAVRAWRNYVRAVQETDREPKHLYMQWARECAYAALYLAYCLWTDTTRRAHPDDLQEILVFRTSRPCFGTLKSHISHVVADAPTWEHSVAFQLERLDWVIAYAKNDHLDFVIPYEWQGRRENYRPDFLVRLHREDGSEMTAILEVKGYEQE